MKKASLVDQDVNALNRLPANWDGKQLVSLSLSYFKSVLLMSFSENVEDVVNGGEEIPGDFDFYGNTRCEERRESGDVTDCAEDLHRLSHDRG